MMCGDPAPSWHQTAPGRGVAHVVLTNAILLLGPALHGCAHPDAQTQSLADLPTFPVEEDLRIDGRSADLVPIRWMATARNGTIAVCQEQLRGIRFFDAEAKDLGLVGGPGEGPGEFRALSDAGWIGDTLWVSDGGLKRVTLISTEPEVIRTLPQIPSIHPSPEDTARFPVTSAFSIHGLHADGGLLARVPGAEGFRGSPLFRVSRDGDIERLILEIPSDPLEMLQVRSGARISSVRVPFYPTPRWAVAPHGTRIGTVTTHVSTSRNGTLDVDLFDPTGNRILGRSYEFHGIPVPDDAVDSVLEPRIDHLSSLGVLSEVKSRIPPVYPPVEKILLGADERIWLRLFRGDGREEWVILNEEGDPEGRVVLPARTILHVANSTQVWALERDEWDVESVVRFRLHGLH